MHALMKLDRFLIYSAVLNLGIHILKIHKVYFCTIKKFLFLYTTIAVSLGDAHL